MEARMNRYVGMAAIIFITATMAAATAGANPIDFVVPASRSGSQDAAYACWLANPYKPAWVLNVSPDGVGDYDVTVVDRDGDRWQCNASPFGDVYWNDLE